MRKRASSPMVITMKGIFKGLKIIIKIFTVHKEHEIEIGYPADVRHVSHIGLGGSEPCPNWMNEFSGAEEASTGSIGCVASQASWASLDLEERLGVLLPAEMRPDSSINDAVFSGSRSGPSPRESTRRRATKKSRSSAASFATSCEDSSELHSAAPIPACTVPQQ